MSYETVRPPLADRFNRAPKTALKAYRQWFEAAIPGRIEVLREAVRATAGFRRWKPDLTPSSLDALGRWLEGQVDTRPLTKAEIAAIAAESARTFPIPIPERELSDRTISLAMDIGMYVGEVVLRNVAKTRWDQPLGGKLNADYGQMLLRGPGSVPFNPIRVVEVLAQRSTRGIPIELERYYRVNVAGLVG